MAREQMLPAFVGGLLAQGVTIPQIEAATEHVESLLVGRSITPDVLGRAWTDTGDALVRYVFAIAKRIEDA